MTMAKMVNNAKKEKEIARAKDIDTRVQAIMELDAKIKDMEATLKQMKVDFAANYFIKDNKIPEEIIGNEYKINKVPFLTKKAYNIGQLKMVMKNNGVDYKHVINRKVVMEVNEKMLKQLVEGNIIDGKEVEKTITGNQSFKMCPKKI